MRIEREGEEWSDNLTVLSGLKPGGDGDPNSPHREHDLLLPPGHHQGTYPPLPNGGVPHREGPQPTRQTSSASTLPSSDGDAL